MKKAFALPGNSLKEALIYKVRGAPSSSNEEIVFDIVVHISKWAILWQYLYNSELQKNAQCWLRFV